MKIEINRKLDNDEIEQAVHLFVNMLLKKGIGCNIQVLVNNSITTIVLNEKNINTKG